MSDLKTAVSQTIKYADGSETIIRYNPLGEKMSEEIIEEVVAEESTVEVEAPAEAPSEEVKEAEEAPATEEVV